MSKQKRNTTILVAFIVLLIGLIGGYYVLSNRNNDTDTEKETLNLIEYEVYDYDKVDFRFVIAEIGLMSDNALDIDLNEIKVNNLKLDSKDEYIAKLKEAGYEDDFSDLDEIFSINDDKESVKLFLPIINDNQKEAKVTSEFFDDLEIDLSKNITVSKDDDDNDEEVKPDLPSDDDNKDDEVDKNDQVIEESGFKLIVHPSFNLRDFNYLVGGEEFNSATSEVLHAIPITLVSKDNAEYEITAAKFVFDDIDGDIQAEDGTFETMDAKSILNKKTVSKTDGALIFISYSQGFDDVTYKGKVMIKVNNGEWFELEVKI